MDFKNIFFFSVVFGAMMSANGCLVIENIPPTKGIAQPDLIMASARATPKKMIKTSRGTIENKKSQFKQAHPNLDSQVWHYRLWNFWDTRFNRIMPKSEVFQKILSYIPYFRE